MKVLKSLDLQGHSVEGIILLLSNVNDRCRISNLTLVDWDAWFSRDCYRSKCFLIHSHFNKGRTTEASSYDGLLTRWSKVRKYGDGPRRLQHAIPNRLWALDSLCRRSGCINIKTAARSLQWELPFHLSQLVPWIQQMQERRCGGCVIHFNLPYQ